MEDTTLNPAVHAALHSAVNLFEPNLDGGMGEEELKFVSVVVSFEPVTLNPRPSALNPEPGTLNPKP